MLAQTHKSLSTEDNYMKYYYYCSRYTDQKEKQREAKEGRN